MLLCLFSNVLVIFCLAKRLAVLYCHLNRQMNSMDMGN